MYQLYFSPGACSRAIGVILNELGQPCEFINANRPGTKDRSATFLAINPRGQVPVLVVDGVPVSEGGALITYLCDTHDDGTLLPKQGLPRLKALEALMFCNSTLHPAYGKAFAVFKSPFDEALKKQLLDQACSGIQKLLNEVDEKLGRQAYLAGSRMTAADILLTVIAGWGTFDNRLTLGPNLQRLAAEIAARPAFIKMIDAENSENRAAA